MPVDDTKGKVELDVDAKSIVVPEEDAKGIAEDLGDI